MVPRAASLICFFSSDTIGHYRSRLIVRAHDGSLMPITSKVLEIAIAQGALPLLQGRDTCGAYLVSLAVCRRVLPCGWPQVLISAKVEKAALMMNAAFVQSVLLPPVQTAKAAKCEGVPW